MDKLKMQSHNVTGSNTEKIAQLFPNCVTERLGKDGKPELAIDFEKLRAELSNEIITEGEERYQFTWPDKRASVRLANTPTTMTLRPYREESVDFDNTQNLYIEGDNLDVLKVLRETYLGKVKMIYIDPPYNTGNDFVYNDDFAQGKDDFEQSSGLFDEEDNQTIDRMQRNTESNGRFHTDWLNMIYPRLKVARDLLTEDGVIFISIDDNEVENLKKICNEIFGVNNIETLIWNKEAEGSSGTLKSTKTTRRIHEYILCVFKNYKQVQFEKIHEALKGRENEFQTANLAVNIENERNDHPNYFTITNPNGDSFTRQWKWSMNEIKELIEQELIYWGSDGHKQPRLIIPTDERRTTYLLSILNYGGTTIGRKDFEILMGDKLEFPYPKPIILLRKIIETATFNNSFILDFFSGSATTAHAVMKLNAEDGGNRKFIMVQLPEVTDEKSEAYKAGYKNICEIGKERIRRAGRKIKDELGVRNEELGIKLDVGFRVLKLDTSNMEDVYYTPQEFSLETLFNENVKEDRTNEDLLFQVMLDLGIELSAKIESKQIAGKNVHFVDDNYLVACFDAEVNETTITEIAKLQPIYFVMRDASAANDNVIDNFEQIFKHYSPDTVCKII